MAQGKSPISPNEKTPTAVLRTYPTPPDEQSSTTVQRTSPILPDEQPSTLVRRTSPILPDKQPPTVVQQTSAVRPVSPVPPYEQLPTILQSATPVPVKSSYFEEIITNIEKEKSKHYFEKQLRQNLILKSKRDLKIEKKATVEYFKDCFGEMLDNMDFVSWISNKLGYKPDHTNKLLEEKANNK